MVGVFPRPDAHQFPLKCVTPTKNEGQDFCMSEYPARLEAIFGSVGSALETRQAELNRMDEINHNHGDHMVEIFHLAARAGQEMQAAPMADAMDHAGQLLGERKTNGSALVYGRGLRLLAAQFRQRQIDLDDLLPVVRGYLRKQEESVGEDSASSGEVLKGMVAALAEWEQVEASLAKGEASQKPFSGVDMGYMFGVGMAYLQAKQKGGDRLDILSETVVSASPLGSVAYRHASGVIAVRALLEAMGAEG
jgi:hypothetical protein